MPPKKAVSSKRQKAPLFEFKLTFETAAALESELNASRVHAKLAADQGHPALLVSCQQSEKFYNALCEYLNQYQ